MERRYFVGDATNTNTLQDSARKRRKNATTRILQLPDDVLRLIMHQDEFWYLNSISLDIDGESISLGERRMQSITLWSFMFVCFHLRSVAVADSTLWSTIYLSWKTREWYDMMVQRAGGTALDIYGYLDPAQAERLTPQMVSQTWRMQLIIMWGYRHASAESTVPGDLKTYLEDRFSLARSSQMTCLELYNYDKEGSVLLPSNMLNDGIPNASSNITQLILVNCGFDGVPLLPTLQRLTVENTRLDTQYTTLRALLCKTPAVSHLRLKDMPILGLIFPNMGASAHLDAAEIMETQSPVSLPLLSHLELIGGPTQVARFMHLLPDPSQKLTINALYHYSTSNLLESSASVMRTLLTRSTRFMKAAVEEHQPSPYHMVLTPVGLFDGARAYALVIRQDGGVFDEKALSPSVDISLQVRSLSSDLYDLVAFAKEARLAYQTLGRCDSFVSGCTWLTHIVVYGNTHNLVRDSHNIIQEARRTIRDSEFRTRGSGPQNALERLLSRIATNGTPVKSLIILLSRDEPKQDEQAVFRQRWESAGWAEEVIFQQRAFESKW